MKQSLFVSCVHFGGGGNGDWVGGGGVGVGWKGGGEGGGYTMGHLLVSTTSFRLSLYSSATYFCKLNMTC
jgi:hypothetical protein